jgi:hypothetical protein
MEQETEYSGVLFGNIKYSSDEQIESIINNMEYQQAIFFLTKAIEFSYGHNIYSLVESEILSKSLRIFNQKNFSIDK